MSKDCPNCGSTLLVEFEDWPVGQDDIITIETHTCICGYHARFQIDKIGED